jgi:hypothetical protein
MKTSFKFSIKGERSNGWNDQPLTPNSVSLHDSTGGKFKADFTEHVESKSDIDPFTSLINGYKKAFEVKKEVLYASIDLLKSELKLAARAGGLFIVVSVAAMGISLFIWFLINAFLVTLLHVSGTSFLSAIGVALLLNCVLGAGLIKAALYYKQLASFSTTRCCFSTLTQQDKKAKE